MLICKVVITTREPENTSLSYNGGDYYEGFTIKEYKKHKAARPVYYIREWSSCEMLEGTFQDYVVSRKEVKRIVSKCKEYINVEIFEYKKGPKKIRIL